MSNRSRIAILGVAVLVLVGAFFIARGSGDGDSEQTLSPAETVENPGSSGATDPGAATQPAETEAAPPPPRVETIRLRDNGPVGEPRTLKFKTGDTVRLRFRSDTAGEVHVHGYDREADVPAGGTGRLTFKADAEGIFEVESHTSGQLLAKLQVGP